MQRPSHPRFDDSTASCVGDHRRVWAIIVRELELDFEWCWLFSAIEPIISTKRASYYRLRASLSLRGLFIVSDAAAAAAATAADAADTTLDDADSDYDMSGYPEETMDYTDEDEKKRQSNIDESKVRHTVSLHSERHN
jgi:hypothetical protein